MWGRGEGIPLSRLDEVTVRLFLTSFIVCFLFHKCIRHLFMLLIDGITMMLEIEMSSIKCGNKERNKNGSIQKVSLESKCNKEVRQGHFKRIVKHF